MESTVYDLCVVGAGMIGSAAAKYACLHKNNPKVCLIGQEEPKDKATTDIFASHYDEARITRSTDSDPIWAKLAQRSIAMYAQIEQESGIAFYNNVGCLSVGEKGGEFITSNHRNALDHGVAVECLDHNQVSERFPGMVIRPSDTAILASKDAGTVNPRRLVTAQQIIAAGHGCDRINDNVRSIEEKQKDKETVLYITTDMGKTLWARKALLATGVFTTFRSLLPSGVEPAIMCAAQFLLFAEVSEEQRKTMGQLPCYIYHAEEGMSTDRDCYILPPVQYPDGKYYIKIGHGDNPLTLTSNEEITRWYRDGTAQRIQDLLYRALMEVFPGLKPVSISTDTCCTAKTPTVLPYVDLLTPRLGVALGGNGYAAKSSDAIGKLASDLVIEGEWTSDLPQEKLRFQAKMEAKL